MVMEMVVGKEVSPSMQRKGEEKDGWGRLEGRSVVMVVEAGRHVVGYCAGEEGRVVASANGGAGAAHEVVQPLLWNHVEYHPPATKRGPLSLHRVIVWMADRSLLCCFQR